MLPKLREVISQHTFPALHTAMHSIDRKVCKREDPEVTKAAAKKHETLLQLCAARVRPSTTVLPASCRRQTNVHKVNYFKIVQANCSLSLASNEQ